MHEPTAVAFTDVPERLRHFVRQRARWARGMFEGLAAVPPWRQRRLLSGLVASVDFLIPLLDIGYVLVWIPGLALAVAGLPVIVGLWTLLVLPITLGVYGTLRHYQRRRVFGPLGLRVRRNRRGYLAYLLLYQALCSSAALIGYTQELTRSRRRWK
jgi:biofilm PGA synthesis N-glycosyltransferase PgaC